jgi:RNA polymerase sigma factor (sigma-70 family)
VHEDLPRDDVLWNALARLPNRQRTVLALRYYDDLSEAEIARVLGIAPGTVKSQASKGIASLRASIGERESLWT